MNITRRSLLEVFGIQLFKINDIHIPPNAIYAPYRMRHLRQTLGRLTSRREDLLTHVCFGASWLASRYGMGRVCRQMQSTFGAAGVGWIDLAYRHSHTDVTHPSAGATEQATFERDANWDVQTFGAGTANLGLVTTSKAGAVISINSRIPQDGAYIWGLSGTIRTRFNAGPWSTKTFTGFEMYHAAGVPSDGAWILDIEVVSGPAKLMGVFLAQGSAGVRWYNWGKGGTNSVHWLSIPESTFLTQLGATAAASIHINIGGGNDQSLGGVIQTRPEEYYANMTRFVQRCRAALPDVDILLVSDPQQRDETKYYPIAEYQAALRRVAEEQKCAHLNLQGFFGDKLSDYAYNGRRPLMNATGHPNSPEGRATLFQAYWRALVTE